MSPYQQLWFEQTRSDHSVLILLRKLGASPCHQLHYLQMVTEKLGKAYFWRTGSPPPKSPVSFVRFLQTLDDRPRTEVDRIAKLLGFSKAVSLEAWIKSISPLAHALERLAPALAGDAGPNPEYPWPRTAPLHAPATFGFEIWTELMNTTRGRQFLQVVDTAVAAFPSYC
ncbi:MAG: hypothetical protein H7062_12255 [Candidatus Saccharimonas sp.]|nr:hypothetical protein [Planctomycetaceae bacterium]